MADPARVLIVDDNEHDRDLLNDLIVSFGHKPVTAENGISALGQMRQLPPDLVLLDIMMPEMDGYEVLDRIRSDTSLAHIPTIMISSADEMESVVLCIGKGADDYLVKPFDHTLLRARVGAALEKKRLRDQEEAYRRQIEEYNVRLGERVAEKTSELSEAQNRLRILDKAKSDFLLLISHELRTPLTGVLGAAEMGLFEDNLDDATREELQQVFQVSRDRLVMIIEQALLLTQIQVSGEAADLELNSVHSALESAVELASEFAEFHGVAIGKVPDSDELVISEKDLLTKALAALLETGVRFSSEGNVVSMSCEALENEICIGIQAIGRTIPEEAIPKFFEVFAIDPIVPGGGLGLGPPVAACIIWMFGGSVTVENQPGLLPGISFSVRLWKRYV